MKLQQNQVWKKNGELIRIVVLERLQVEYLVMKSLADRDATRHQASKKAFCRLLKGAVLLPPPGVPPARASDAGSGSA